MICLIGRVVSKVDSKPVTTKDGGQLPKCFLRVKEIGDQYADEYVFSVLGNVAQVNYEEGQLVGVAMRFRVFESNGGGMYQDVEARDIVKL